MSFLNKKMTWTNAEFIPFKLCIASIYLIAGAYFSNFVQHYYIPLFVLFVISVIWTLYLWVRKMNRSNQDN
ncbi:hypothetical protein [Niabella soli]|uniref:Uncharacterized protein n=1 Tax=Niabella soli DSM 19437 TaxID=929713 RepID=W0F1U8_9BACT|nr:hypothetical protein [Niabella soli]AHF15301.1 hypothetical protein NIASO_09320 [Niabella soli DSM 19437]